MKKITPYTALADAQAAFDNGGRFYHLFSHAGDQEITKSELGVAAGIHGDVQLALFYELAVHDLRPGDRATLESQFTTKLRTLIQENRPQIVVPEVFNRDAREGAPYVITGSARAVDDESLVTGTLMMPIMVGEVTSFMPIPITEHFQVLKVRADAEPECTVLVPKGCEHPIDQPVRWAGVAKEGTNKDGNPTEGPLYLHASLYSPAG